MGLKHELCIRGNDYSPLVNHMSMDDFLLRDYANVSPGRQQTISVVLPSYNVSTSLPKTLIALDAQTYHNIEVVVADDHSSQDLLPAIASARVDLPVKFVRNTKNRDRSYVRNTGLTIADGEIILILDPDMVPCPTHVANLVERIAPLQSAVLVGMKHHIDPEDEAVSDANIRQGKIAPDYQKDWRVSRTYRPDIFAPNFMQEKEPCARDVYLLQESEYFRTLGHNRVIAAWDLPSLALGHTLCFKKDDAIRAGGFVEEFVGWGHDDIAFATRMIAQGNYIIPCVRSVGYHLNHAPHSGTKEKKLTEFHENLERYVTFVEQDIKAQVFTPHTVKKTGQSGNITIYEGP